MAKYLRVQFTKGLAIQGYQVIENGAVQRFVDLAGNELVLPDVVEYHHVVQSDYAAHRFEQPAFDTVVLKVAPVDKVITTILETEVVAK